MQIVLLFCYRFVMIVGNWLALALLKIFKIIIYCKIWKLKREAFVPRSYYNLSSIYLYSYSFLHSKCFFRFYFFALCELWNFITHQDSTKAYNVFVVNSF
jgi:hypothetical protein